MKIENDILKVEKCDFRGVSLKMALIMAAFVDQTNEIQVYDYKGHIFTAYNCVREPVKVIGLKVVRADDNTDRIEPEIDLKWGVYRVEFEPGITKIYI